MFSYCQKHNETHSGDICPKCEEEAAAWAKQGSAATNSEVISLEPHWKSAREIKDLKNLVERIISTLEATRVVIMQTEDGDEIAYIPDFIEIIEIISEYRTRFPKKP
jgi:hypothetical protein